MSARNECFSSDLLMIVIREDKVVEKSEAAGVISAVYVEDMAGGAGSGARSVKSAYSSYSKT